MRELILWAEGVMTGWHREAWPWHLGATSLHLQPARLLTACPACSGSPNLPCRWELVRYAIKAKQAGGRGRGVGSEQAREPWD